MRDVCSLLDLQAAQRILVIGSPGTGKSTLAQAIGAATGLPVIHLDRVYHDPDHRYFEDRPRWRAHLIGSLVQEPRWVMDGHYPATLRERVAAADVVVHLDYPVRVALAGIVKRRWRPAETRADMPDDWRERVSLSLAWSVTTFRIRETPRVRRLLDAAPSRTVIVRLRNRTDAEQLLESLAGIPR